MKTINLNKDWHIYRRDDAFSLVTAVPEDAVKADLPYDALFHDEQTSDSMNGGRTGYFDGGVYYYQKEVFIPEEERGKMLFLKTEGAFSRSFIYINGSLADQCDFGYAGQTSDITPYIRYGVNNTFMIVCKTDLYSSRWYCGTGLLRPVTLLIKEPVYIEEDSLFVSCENIDEDGASIRVRADLVSILPASSVMQGTIRITSSGTCVCEETFSLRVRDRYQIDRRLYLRNAHLYSEEDPYLYDVTVTVGEETASVRTGFRKETFDAVHGLRINGKTVKLRGACIHHDEGILGGVAEKGFEYYRVKRLKKAGFNAIRSAHNHPSQELLEVCDELGVWVLDEVCDMWTKMKGFGDYAQNFSRSWKQTVDQTVKGSRNHPCVVGYSSGNEISEINTDRGFEAAHDIFEEIHLLDDTRFVTNGVNGAFAAGDEVIDIAVDLTGKDRSFYASGDVNRFMALMASRMKDITLHPVVTKVLERLETSTDVQGYNYMTARYAEDAVNYPNRIMLGTETYPKDIAENWRIITSLPQCIGDFTWTGWDYMGELSQPYPALNNDSGDLDRFGFRRPVSYYREIVFGLRTEPYVCVRPPEKYGTPRMFGPWKFTDAKECWTYDIPPGTPLTAEVYTAEESVSLYINGELQETKETHDCFALFDTAYMPGEIKAVTPSGKEYVIHTADPKSAHIVTYDTEAEDMIMTRIELRDKDGNLVFGSGQEYQTEREGMELLAAASENTVHDHGFLNRTIHLYGHGGFAVYRKK